MKYRPGDILTNGEDYLRVVSFDPNVGKYDLVNDQKRKNRWKWFSEQELESYSYHSHSALQPLSEEERRKKRQAYYRKYYLQKIKPKLQALRSY